MLKKHLGINFLILFLCVLFTSNSFALTKGFEASSFHPAVDGGPYFTLYGSETLEKWQWVAGTTMNYSNQPIQLIQNGVRVRGIIDDTFVQDVHGAVGLLDRWLQLGIDVPVGWWFKFTDPNVATASPENKMVVMGDVQLNLKSEFLQLEKYRVGIGLLPFILLPTGSGKYFNGNGGVSGGGKLIFEVKPVDRLRLALNAGILARPSFTLSTNIEQTHQFLYGLGTAINVTDHLSVEVEASGRAKLKDLFGSKEESPIEGDGGFKYAIGNSGFTVDGGGGLGFIKGSGAPKFRVFLGMAYRSPSRVKEVVEKAAPPAALPLDDVGKTVVRFSIDNREFSTLSDAERLVHAAGILKQHPEAKVRVVGYADSTGTKSHNMALSKRRATIVKNYLVQQGVPAKQLEVVGRGAASPCADNKTAEGRALNRRVELKVVK